MTKTNAVKALLIVLFALELSIAQTTNGTISGIVFDPNARAITGAEILIVNDVTGVSYRGTTNGEGIYAIPNLPPGPYRIQVAKFGFKTLIKPDIILHIEDALAINFTLSVGAASEIVTVEGGAPLVDTESASVGTVIDRNFVESLPLNGRSFNTLLQLTPGVVIAQQGPNFSSGQFSVAGQRTSANDFLVDGVSANFGVSSTAGVKGSGTGTQQAFSALGGTSSLVSVEALQEFRVETSSFAPEFGRSPGGEVILNTRSGTNELHGGVYEYFRNDVMDANNWFANQAGKPRAPERHNDFGAFAGGPVWRDRTFFFLSYEGARLRQPGTLVTEVPSNYARSIVSSQLASFLDAYPQPDDRALTPGVYASKFTGNFSNPATLNAGSARIDQTFSDRFSIFLRYNEAPSETAVRTNALSEVDSTAVGTRTITLGATKFFGPRVSNTFRGNFSRQNSSLVFSLDSFGGAVVPDSSIFAPDPLNASETYVSFDTFDTSVYQMGPNAKNRSTQWNFADDVSITEGSHQFKMGGDYRAIVLDAHPYKTFADYFTTSVSDFIASAQASIYGVSSLSSTYLIQATSLYAQDTWKIGSRLTATYGVRWEFNPAPSARGATTLAAWRNVETPSKISLAPPGSPLWNTTYADFAPRIGIAYGLSPKGGLVLRAGWGLFYDVASSTVGGLGTAFPNDASIFTPNVNLPLNAPSQYFPTPSTAPPYTGNVLGFSPNLELPRSFQWNVALEKSFRGPQALSLTYVGQSGERLLRQEGISRPNASFAPGTNFLLTRNDGHSNYNGLQVQYRKPSTNGLQILANYTYSHSLDNASDDTVTGVSNTVIPNVNDSGSSSFDVRQSLSGALTYSFPPATKYRLRTLFTRDWSFDAVLVARSGFPFNASIESGSLAGANPRPNLVPGQPVWISNSVAGGGKSLNPAAFSVPSTAREGTEGRNDISGFGMVQADPSIAKKFPVTDRIGLQFRADAFNVFNHPNFTNPYGYIGLGSAFLESPSTLNVGLGGLNPLFQEGGPRSLQLSLRLSF